MSTISSIVPAQGTATAGAVAASGQVASEGAAGLFQALLGGLLGMTAGVAIAPSGETAADGVAADGDGNAVDTTTASAMASAAAMAAMQPMTAIATAQESATAVVAVDPTAVGADMPAADAATALPVPADQAGDVIPDGVLLQNGVAVPTADAASNAAAPTLENAIQAAAANIGRSTERAFAGRRFDDPAVTGKADGSALQAIDGDPAATEVAGFARVAVNATAGTANGQTAGNSGDSAGDELASLLKPEVSKSGEVNKPALGADSKLDFSTLGTAPQVKGNHDLAASAVRSGVPESVSVRDLGDVVVRSVHYASGKTEDVVTVRLVPRSLGELQIAVRHAGDAVEVVMTAANAAARDALEGHMAGLREALGREGMDAARVTIQVASHFDASYQPSFAQQGNPDTASQSQRHTPSAYREPQNAGSQNQERQEPRRQRHEGRLNMWI